MAKGSIDGLMEGGIKATTMKIKEKATAFTFGQMARSMKVNGKMEKEMELARSSSPMEIKKVDFGLMISVILKQSRLKRRKIQIHLKRKID